ncbi:non-homologous end-joining DNA ligase [Haloechinothrix salitolerans]|uniref:DNA ligase (ATP) n=1 Tax=Haloechinothrix salitolerans TaxID=926830 RepID=A0ABW2C260_9PSEU
MSLHEYRRKRRPGRTPEPMPDADEPEGETTAAAPVFVVQEHHARRTHYDLRLERDGVLASWAVPKGIPDDPAVNHLAIRTEDHPLAYATFAGTIPRGEYGAGTMRIADSGTYECLAWTDREVKIVLHGSRYTGGFALFRTDDDHWMIHRERVPPPRGLLPMLAGGSGMPVDDEGWGYELKWDGQRALAYVENAQVRLVGRSARDITSSYPELAALAKELPRRGAVLDGEIVAFAGGTPSFAALQPRMHATGDAARRLAANTPITYLIFDVLHLDGRPLLDVRYQERQRILAELDLAGPSWHTPPAFLDAPGETVLRAAEQQGLEGIVAKRLSSRYLPGVRSPDWRKIKHLRQQEVVVGGWRPGKGVREGRIGSLLVGVGTHDGLAYAGRVGTGFDEATLRLLGERLAPLARESSPFDTPVPADHVRDARWVEPEVVVQVSFDRWTRDDRLRHPVYLGLRDDIDPRDVVREP